MKNDLNPRSDAGGSPKPRLPRLSMPLKHALLLASLAFQLGASHRSPNFVVTASSTTLARSIADSAEHHRRELAVEWLGEPLPRWRRPCLIEVTDGADLALDGRTSYVLDRGRPVDWRITLIGPREQIRESVLPHEILHSVLATHFGRPLPRSIEEGICVLAESDESRASLSRDGLLAEEPMSVTELLSSRAYPRDVVRFYSHGYSLTQFMLARGGRRKLIRFLEDGLSGVPWNETARRHYGIEGLDQMQREWTAWRKAEGR